MHLNRKRTVVLCLAALSLLVSTGVSWRAVKATQDEKPITFMGTLAEWKYPNTTPRLYGGQMSDGGNPEIQDLSCKGVMTTADPIEEVIKFYSKKLGAESPKGKEARAVADQEDSADRPVTVRIISVYKADTTNTIVISRGENEKETHIAWTHYRRFPKP